MSGDEFREELTNPPGDGASPPKRARCKPIGAGEDQPKPTPRRDDPPIDVKPGSGPDGETTPEDLDEDAREFARLRRDLPNVEGSAAVGILSIGVTKAPPKNEFFRTKKGFRPIVDLVVDQVGMDQKYHAVHPCMAEELQSIGIAYAPHKLFLILTSKGAFRVIPVRCPDAEGARNDYAATKELILREAEDTWLRLFTDLENSCYRRYPAPHDRFPPPVWPELTDAKIFKLCFRARGQLIELPDHPRFVEWSARKAEDK